jgi:hypothetical protein
MAAISRSRLPAHFQQALVIADDLQHPDAANFHTKLAVAALRRSGRSERSTTPGTRQPTPRYGALCLVSHG